MGKASVLKRAWTLYKVTSYGAFFLVSYNFPAAGVDDDESKSNYIYTKISDKLQEFRLEAYPVAVMLQILPLQFATISKPTDQVLQTKLSRHRVE